MPETGEREARAGLEVLDAMQDHRAAQLGAARQELASREPVHGDDAVIETRGSRRRHGRAAERYAQERDARLFALPEIDADDLARREAVAGFLERLAHGGLGERLARLEVTRGLIQYRRAADHLLDE